MLKVAYFHAKVSVLSVHLAVEPSITLSLLLDSSWLFLPSVYGSPPLLLILMQQGFVLHDSQLMQIPRRLLGLILHESAKCRTVDRKSLASHTLHTAGTNVRQG